MIRSFSVSFKDRIALYYLLSTVLLIGLVFVIVYRFAKTGINDHINEEIKIEQKKQLQNIDIDSHGTYLIQVNQWQERENNSVDVNPVFVEFYDQNRRLIDKSPNLKNNDLVVLDNAKNDQFVDTELNGKKIRQIQTSLKQDGKNYGYVVVAMALEDLDFLDILRRVLLISFPLTVLTLFFAARFFAGRSIQPINTIIQTTNRITKDNLSSRIPLPQNKDELYHLSQKINELLERIEKTLEREKQFTSDASHELRTPLAVIKGTLEVLVRKARTTEEYNAKINYCIKEVDRLNYLVDELLLLARFENQKEIIKKETINLNTLVLDSFIRHSNQIQSKSIQFTISMDDDILVQSDHYSLSIIFNNLLSNAIKYSHPKGKVSISVEENDQSVSCFIKDNGFGIPADEQEKIFGSFYRSKTVHEKGIKGTGVGLSIVKRLCDLLDITILVESQPNLGTTITLKIPKSA